MWFHNINNFKLEIYDKTLAEYVINSRTFGSHSGYDGGGFVDLFEMIPSIQTTLFGRTFGKKWSDPETKINFIQFLVDNNYINSEWISCLEWYLKREKSMHRADSMFGRWIFPFLYRSINPRMYKELLKYGSITSALTDQFEDGNFRMENLPRSEYIWAAELLEKAWEYANKTNPSIIIIYRKKYFYHRKITNNANHVWVKRDKNIDYRDTIEAIISVRYY